MSLWQGNGYVDHVYSSQTVKWAQGWLLNNNVKVLLHMVKNTKQFQTEEVRSLTIDYMLANKAPKIL